MAPKTSIFSAAFARHNDVVARSMQQILPDIEKAGVLLIAALRQGRKVLACGNGGSAADSSHFVEELIGRYKNNRRPLPAIALTGDNVVLTVISNDFGYDQVFARQVEALGKKGDILVAFSTSGKSPNVVNAMAAARRKKMQVIALTGENGEGMRKISDIAVVVPTTETARIQEVHEITYHSWCEAIDAALFKV
jgi:D-sedoheptulose 7-phosphate isomerase